MNEHRYDDAIDAIASARRAVAQPRPDREQFPASAAPPPSRSPGGQWQTWVQRRIDAAVASYARAIEEATGRLFGTERSAVRLRFRSLEARVEQLEAKLAALENSPASAGDFSAEPALRVMGGRP